MYETLQVPWKDTNKCNECTVAINKENVRIIRHISREIRDMCIYLKFDSINCEFDLATLALGV